MPTRRPDFEAHLRFLSPEEGGRKTPVIASLTNYRPDMRYLDDPATKLWAMWPSLYTTDNGTPIPPETPLPSVVKVVMYIANEQMRVSEHRSRLQVGTLFQVMEGPWVVAEGTVTKIVGLFDD